MAQHILNPTTSRVVYSDDARVIAGGERIHDVELDGTTRRAIARGDLILEADQDETLGADMPEPADTDAAAPGEPDPEDGR